MDVLSYIQPLPCDCPSPSRLIFWAEKHSWTKALQPSLLMSSTENAETPFSFKVTAHLHATEYALSLLCSILSVWTGPETSCLPQVGKQRRHTLIKTSYCKAGCDDVRAPTTAQSRPELSQSALSPPSSHSPSKHNSPAVFLKEDVT